MLLLVNNLHEKKSIAESQDRQDFESMCPICNLPLYYNHALLLQLCSLAHLLDENALVFSPSRSA